MSSIRLQIFPGTYENDSAYEYVLTYVYNKYSTGGYGYYPFDIKSIIHDFEQSKQDSYYKQDRNIWHFAITFSPDYNHCPDFFFMSLAQQVALIYCNDYQVYYGLDKDTDNPHIHFAVNAYSYHPQAEPLSDSKMEQLLHYAHSKITHLFPKTKVTLSYSKEEY